MKYLEVKSMMCGAYLHLAQKKKCRVNVCVERERMIKYMG